MLCSICNKPVECDARIINKCVYHTECLLHEAENLPLPKKGRIYYAGNRNEVSGWEFVRASVSGDLEKMKDMLARAPLPHELVCFDDFAAFRMGVKYHKVSAEYLLERYPDLACKMIEANQYEAFWCNMNTAPWICKTYLGNKKEMIEANDFMVFHKWCACTGHKRTVDALSWLFKEYERLGGNHNDVIESREYLGFVIAVESNYKVGRWLREIMGAPIGVLTEKQQINIFDFD
jgi:hypothetical protein